MDLRERFLPSSLRHSVPRSAARPSLVIRGKAVALQMAAQFRGLDRNDPSGWPDWPRRLLYVVISFLVVALLWLLWLRGLGNDLDAERLREAQLRTDYGSKLAMAANLDQLKQERVQVQQYVNELERQLPSKAEMGALLSDINQAGLERNLAFDLFKPGEVVQRDYYAEQSIAVRVNGTYHDMGNFAADIARLPRIVTLHDLVIMQDSKSGSLSLDATARTYRYLDEAEIEMQKQAKGKSGGRGGRS